YTWNAIFVPKNTPADVVKKLNDAIVQAIKTPSVRERLSTLGAQVVSDDRATPAFLGQLVKSEIEKWAAPIKASGVVVDWSVYSSSIVALISCVNSSAPIVIVALVGSFSSPLRRPSASAWRTAFSISRWAPTPRVLRNLRKLPFKVSSFMAYSRVCRS